jgi:ubiquinone/menaquinone biosynthesis C-methylase UbiE
MGLWNRVFASAYDRSLARAERLGIAQARAMLLARARGRILEIGAGTGLNVEHYPAGADVTYTEPDPHMAKRLRARGAAAISAGAESLPFDDSSFDTVVSTLVLCTVTDVPAALREIRRVLRPDGELLFLEHVRAKRGSALERWQDRLQRPWRAIACGCNCNRDLLAALGAESFSVVGTNLDWKFMPPLVRPVVTGVASPRAA